jgi:glycosyltransferase involved in cell wall biosynthesis
MILLDPSNNDCTKKSNLIDCTKCQIQSKIIPVCTVWKSDIKNIDQFISPSDYLKKIHLKSDKMFSGKIKTIHNAIQDPKKSKPLDDKPLMDSSKFNVLFVGRLEKEKGILDLVIAFQQLDENFHLYIVGTGRLLNSLQSSNSVKSQNSKISVLGPVSSEILNKCYMECTIVCLPSAWKENCSMVLIEALSYGKPCVTTNMGGNPEIIVDNKNGFIVNVHSPNQIAIKITELYQNNALYESMCKEALSIYEKEFSLSSLGKNLNQLYSELLKK